MLLVSASLLSCTAPLRPMIPTPKATETTLPAPAVSSPPAAHAPPASTTVEQQVPPETDLHPPTPPLPPPAVATRESVSEKLSGPRHIGGSAVLTEADLRLPPVAREFRGVWVASVGNIDWPSKPGLSSAEAKAELIALLDQAVALRLNAVIFQVRPAADALYASKLEPWSEYLTGTQGKAPEPLWDPLEVAVREAHARGLELHAWFNPYRAQYASPKSPLAPDHIARTSPALVKRYGPYLWMDPGEPAVRKRTLDVVLDVVRRYDIDGVHIDDYFYPYQERTRAGKLIEFPDDASYKRYTAAGGKLARDDWRRENVNTLVRELYEGVHEAKPWVRFGISPFGIWRPGYPAQVKGLDAYATLYADARKWWREGWVDYFTPQLYWASTREAQSYSALLEWWSSENLKRRHLWPGNYTTRTGGTGASAWPMSELLAQIELTRANSGATGNVHFSMTSFLSNQAGMNDVLSQGPYAALALVPATPWLKDAPPPQPVVVFGGTATSQKVGLSTVDSTTPWQYLVRARLDSGWVTAVLPGTASSWTPVPGDIVRYVAVSTVNRLGVTSAVVAVEWGE